MSSTHVTDVGCIGAAAVAGDVDSGHGHVVGLLVMRGGAITVVNGGRESRGFVRLQGVQEGRAAGADVIVAASLSRLRKSTRILRRHRSAG
ncbi:MAG: hypothetical protein HQ453_08615 [Actinobacteria bacterium]|nr:hypothetical protein [Actinomycetota bacterium]